MTQRPIQVLVVEDSAEDLAHVLHLLRKTAHVAVSALTADRVARAVALLRSSPVDVVLLDVSLPDTTPCSLDGLQRVQAAAPTLPVVLLTGHDDDELAERALREGAQDYLCKSTVEERLLERSLRYALERKRGEVALRESEERYALALQGANDGLWDWDLKSGNVYFSPRWKSMLGFESEEVGSEPREWFDRVHPDDLMVLKAEISAHRAGGTPHFKSEHRMLHKDGTYRWVLSRGIAVRNGTGEAHRMAGSQTDITGRKLAEKRLQHDAFHDALTGLPNRALFMDRLGVALAHARRRGDHAYAVLFLDLDRFKNVNDSLGHNVGDELLVAVARRVEVLLRPGDTVARLGGDEFAILLDGVEEPAQATRVAQRINRELSRPFTVQGHEIFVTTSLGITLSSSAVYERPEDVLRDADTAMYRAKAAGKDRHAIFDREMHAHAVALLQLENDLRRAIERAEFVVHYQPIVALASGEIDAFEALLRWNHPSRGMLQPGTFIAMAEDTGLIVPIGWWVLREACRQLAEWQTEGPGSNVAVSVNLSGKQFKQPDLVRRMRRLLREVPVRPGSLRLEMTEGAIMEHGQAAVTKLLQLRELGIKLYIDDFGTGYSSLSYLHRLPVDGLKIDRSFISSGGDTAGRSEIVRSIVTLGRTLGMGVAAEGLETAEQVTRLRGLSCQLGQGFFFSGPVDRSAAGGLIAVNARW
ncbi:MAG TPA: EAL domain-containing protein [Thermoanaerobaculia bacterium]|nr:EAL domain-containing protein [Thermoanaerobaculia bacterium]